MSLSQFIRRVRKFGRFGGTQHCYSLGWTPSSLLDHGSQRWEDYIAVGYIGTADAGVLVDAEENEPAARAGERTTANIPLLHIALVHCLGKLTSKTC